MNIIEKIDQYIDEDKKIVYDCRGCKYKAKCKYKKPAGRPRECPLETEK